MPPVVHIAELDRSSPSTTATPSWWRRSWRAQLGLGVGISSGANLAGAIALQNRMGDDAVVATVFPDSNKKYLTTDLLREEPMRRGLCRGGNRAHRFQRHPARLRHLLRLYVAL